MKKFLSLLGVAALSLSLVACGGSEETDAPAGEGGEAVEETVKLVIGASNIPHAEILEEAAPLLLEKGIEIEIKTFQDYVLPNQALAGGELDANYFQHTPYLESQIADHGYDFVSVGGIHVEPIGVYSQNYASLADLPEGAQIIMSSSVADQGRILMLLQGYGLIELAEGAGVGSTVDDIVSNPKNFDFKYDVEAAMLPIAFENGEGDAVQINTNYALDAGLNPSTDAIAREGSDSPYANVVAVRSEDADRPEFKVLVEVLRSEAIQNFILERFEGNVVPVNE